MKIYILIAAILFLPAVSYHAADSRRDGNWWTNLDKSSKSIYVTGFFDGMELGHNFSYWGNMQESERSSASSAVKSYHEYSKKYLSNVTNIQIVDGLNVFYSDFRNRKIQIFNAIWLVVQQIAGVPDEEMQKMLESWRENA